MIESDESDDFCICRGAAGLAGITKFILLASLPGRPCLAKYPRPVVFVVFGDFHIAVATDYLLFLLYTLQIAGSIKVNYAPIV